MKFPRAYSLGEIADLLDCKFIGDQNFQVLGMNEIHVITPGDIVFVDHPKYYKKALDSAATIILINKAVDCPEGKALLISDNPFKDFNKLTKHFRPFQAAQAAIASSSTIGEGTVIISNCFVGNHVTIGGNCLLYPNVVLYDHTVIGDNVTIQAGTVLGSDAFYYKKGADGFDQLLSGGRVVIQDNVNIGALCTIDRGVSGDTIIGEGTKLDDQIHIGHDTVIGKMCLIASQTGIAGCVRIEYEVTIWGQVGIISGVTIGKKAILLAQSGVGKSLEGGKSYLGSPAIESRKMIKQLVTYNKLSETISKQNTESDI
ncbi:UDP-3-O-(3-hydroxymyristoyl)glucosamine N-acyltransferase [Flavobacterium sp. N502540]|uniref:UDP-3-O-(3-hydroxymyristoyl)glucosamine N-acyltransferase n=1 Tax=Flavobacterium sp. N502540 TaxID=2986838 RepID=UPI002225544D|nr:UDP-3-O-(3-hydroxymyristoyl)glucosamine N-acyltransferase [Flavobacterium sp. N502540]